MIEITENEFIINDEIRIDSLTFEYVPKGDNNCVVTKLLISNIESKQELLKTKISFAFGNDTTDDLILASEYEQTNTYDMLQVATDLGDSVEINSQVIIPANFSDLICFVKIFREDDEDEYNKIFKEIIVERNIVQVTNFFDYVFLSNEAFNPSDKTPFELQQQFYSRDFNKNNNYSYMTDLFFHLKQNNILCAFFGVDSRAFVRDNNSIEILNNNPEFDSYINSLDLIESATGYFYDDNENTYLSPEKFDSGLRNVLGDTLSITKTIEKDFDRTKPLGYNVSISFVDAPVKYLNEKALPKLREEERLLSELIITENAPIQVFTSQISSTVGLYKSFLRQDISNIDSIFTLYDNNSSINVNEQVRLSLLDVNKKVYNELLKSLEAKTLLDNTSDTLSKDFDKVMDISKIDFGVNVLEEKDATINTFNLNEIKTRGLQEASKYSSGDTTSEDYFGYLTSLNVVIEDEQILDNTRSVFDNFTYDDTLDFLNTFNKIINKNIDKKAVVYPSKRLDGLSRQEVLTEDRTEQNNLTLSSVNVTRNVNFRTAKEANSSVRIRENIVKTFQIPTTLTTNLSDGPISLNVPSNESLNQREVNKGNFVGNSLVTYALLNKIKPIRDNRFYETYNSIENEGVDENAPIQAQFLADFYSTDTGEEEPVYLRRERLLNEITNFGLIYHNFKSIFCVKIYSEEDNGFVVLDTDKLASLQPGVNHLCTIDPYNNTTYGMEIPELLRTSIYNRYFILAA